MAVIVKTGDTVPVSGQYRLRGTPYEFTFVKGNRVPPTKDGIATFILVDRTKHSRKD